jgi:hypothetical protein
MYQLGMAYNGLINRKNQKSMDFQNAVKNKNDK